MFLYDPRSGLLREMSAKEAATLLDVNVDTIHYAARKNIKMKSGFYAYREKPSRTLLNTLYAAEVFDGEVWRCFRDTSYYASNFGRIKRIEDGKENFVRPSYVEGNAKVYLYQNRKMTHHYVRRIVAEAFGILRVPTDCVVLKNGDYTNCGVMNLKCLSTQEHKRKKTGRARRKPVVQLDDQRNVVNYFQSTVEAAEVLHINKRTVGRYCDGNVKKPLVRLMWEEEYEQMETAN